MHGLPSLKQFAICFGGKQCPHKGEPGGCGTIREAELRRTCASGTGGPWVSSTPDDEKSGYRFIPAITVGPATLLHFDDASGPYRSIASDGRGRSEYV